MGNNAVKEQLQKDIGYWHADGEIDAATLARLGERYEVQQFGILGIVKYLGICGGFLTFVGFLGLVVTLVDSLLFGVVLLVVAGIGLTWLGLRLVDDWQGRYGTSSKFIITLGVALWGAAVATLCAEVLEMSMEATLFVTGLLSLPLAFWLAYSRGNIYLLILALLLGFHWLGAWNTMLGRSTYAFAVQDPVLMSVAALAAIGIGLCHELYWQHWYGRFYLAWEALGLLYLDMSLLILTLWQESQALQLFWVLLLGAASLAQVVLGARLQNGLLRGFGNTFLVINVYTRFHEYFWEQSELGWFLVGAGVLLALLGFALEVVARKLAGIGGGA